MDGEMTTSTQTTETAATTSAGTSTGAAGQAAVFTFGIHFERCFTLFPKRRFVPKVDTLLFYW